MRTKSLTELSEYLEETQEVLDKSTCFCQYDAKDALAVAWEALRRLSEISALAAGEDGIDA